MTWLISKLLVLSLPFIIGLIAKGSFWYSPDKFIDIVLAMLVLAEGYSVIQNIVSVVQKKEIEEYDAVTAVLNFILRKVKEVIEKQIDK